MQQLTLIATNLVLFSNETSWSTDQNWHQLLLIAKQSFSKSKIYSNLLFRILQGIKLLVDQFCGDPYSFRGENDSVDFQSYTSFREMVIY